MQRIDVVTLFPEMFDPFMKASIVGRAVESGNVKINTVDLRLYSTEKHHSVDEPPYGGGAGMVLGPQPIVDCIEAINEEGTYLVLLSPQGRLFSQAVAAELARKSHLVLVCGHYEGVDARVGKSLPMDEISVGDFVLSGGEAAAITIVDALVRLIPGVLGNEDSAVKESFAMGLLEHPHYTRPREYRGLSVPEILLSGNHREIETWRRRESLRKTLERRVDLFESYLFDDVDRQLLREIVSEKLKQAGEENLPES